jgi:hypothetical protein
MISIAKGICRLPILKPPPEANSTALASYPPTAYGVVKKLLVWVRSELCISGKRMQ